MFITNIRSLRNIKYVLAKHSEHNNQRVVLGLYPVTTSLIATRLRVPKHLKLRDFNIRIIFIILVEMTRKYLESQNIYVE